jgi:chloramphenicol 3-O phosphotransferase
METTAIVLHGTTSAGKTSLAKALQTTAPAPAFHVSLDAFVTMSNRRDMRSDEERNLAYRLHCENMRSTLTRVARTDFDIVLDLVLRDSAEMDACVDVLRTRSICVVKVWAPLHVLEERERSREDRANGMAREQFGHSAFDREYDLTIDTSSVTPEQGAAAIRSYMFDKGKYRANLE